MTTTAIRSRSRSDVTLQQQIRANRFRTFLVLLGFGLLSAVFVGVIAVAYQPGVAGLVGIVAIVYGVVSWFAAGSIIASASGAHKVSKEDQPEVYRLLENVAIAAGMSKTPDLYMIDDPSPNAFAAGRDPEHAYVAVTTGIVKLMDKRELEGVLATRCPTSATATCA